MKFDLQSVIWLENELDERWFEIGEWVQENKDQNNSQAPSENQGRQKW